MSFKNITSIPIKDLSDISSQLTMDEMNNVRVVRQKEKANYEKIFLERSREVHEPVDDTKSEGKDGIINKLRILLSDKYDLSLNDYIILIDRFQLDSSNLNRKNIINLIDYLNTKYNFSQHSIDIVPAAKETIDTQVVNSLDLEQKFKILESERNEMIRNIINNSTTSHTDSTQNKNDLVNVIPHTNQHINPHTNPHTNPSTNDNSIHSDNDRNILTDKIKENIILDISQKTRDQFDITSHNSIKGVNLINNTPHEIVRDINFVKTKKTDILLINLLEYEINGDFCVNVDYNNKNIVENISRIEFIACNTNKNFCDKNGLSKKPHFIIRVEEFENNFYVNGNNLNGFCPILLEKKNSIYSFVNKEQLFGVYKPDEEFKLNKINLSIMDLAGNKLTDFKYTENDQLNIILKIERILV